MIANIRDKGRMWTNDPVLGDPVPYQQTLATDVLGKNPVLSDPVPYQQTMTGHRCLGQEPNTDQSSDLKDEQR